MMYDNEDRYLFCCHCKHLFLKTETDHVLYIQHVKDCLERHVTSLLSAGLVAFPDATYTSTRAISRGWSAMPRGLTPDDVERILGA